MTIQRKQNKVSIKVKVSIVPDINKREFFFRRTQCVFLTEVKKKIFLPLSKTPITSLKKNEVPFSYDQHNMSKNDNKIQSGN